MIRELKTLIAVSTEGTFTAAGNKIGLTQAAVSAQMQRLEEYLGFPLFDRTGRSAKLNTAGLQTLSQAGELIRLASSLGSRDVGQPGGVFLSIGAIASVQRSLLPDVVARFHREFTGCRTRVVPGLSMDLVDQVDAGKIDLAAVIRPPFAIQGDLRWTSLVREPFRLIVPKKLLGDDWSDILANQPFVRYDRASFGGRQVDRFLRSAHIRVPEACEVDELEAIVRLVASGVGVALVPQTASFRRWPATLRAIDLGERTFYREIGLVHRSAQSLNVPSKRFMELLCDRYGVARRAGPLCPPSGDASNT